MARRQFPKPARILLEDRSPVIFQGPDQSGLAMSRLTKQILIIDDHEIFLKAIAAGLTSLGYAVRTASGGFEGIELLQHEIFDLVIVDMIMPEIGGMLVIRLIRQEHPELPILAISGYYDEVSNLLNGADIDGILPKPIRLERLKSTLDGIFLKRMRPSRQTPEIQLTH